MTNKYSSALRPEQEPSTLYKPSNTPRTAKVQTSSYPPTKKNPDDGRWRSVPWINLRGFWLKDVGFDIGIAYSIEIDDRQLLLTAVSIDEG